MTQELASPLTRKELRRALRTWEQTTSFGSSPLTELQIVEAVRQGAGVPDTPTGLGMALRGVLQSALDRIRPSAGDPHPEDERWRDYLILTEQYIHGRAKGYLVEQMHIAASTYDHAQAAALDRLLQLLGEWEARGAVGPETQTFGAARPLQAPAPPFMTPQRLPHGLVGREELLLKLKRILLEREPPQELALHGLPGVGKSALVIELCHDPEVRAHYPDGVLWAAFGPNADPAILLHLLELALGFAPEELAGLPQVQARARAIHTAIGTRHVLLVLDDVWQADIANLLRLGGPYCATMLTTRMPGLAHELHGEQVVAVPELDEKASIELLATLAPQLVTRLESRAQELVQASGGLPLALELIGRALRKDLYGGQPRRLIEALDRLRDPAMRLGLERQRPAIEQPSAHSPESLEAAIALSVDALAEESRRAFCALSVFPPKPNSFDEPAAAAASGQPIQVLDRLVDAGVVEVVAPGRFAVQRTLSDYGRLRLSDVNVRRAFAHYYLNFIAQQREAYRSLDREIHNMLAALEIAHEAGPGLEFIQAAKGLFAYLESAGLVDQGEIILGQARDAAQALGDLNAMAEVLLDLGRAALRKARPTDAAEHIRSALQLAEQIEAAEIRCACLQGLGSAAVQRAAFAEAHELYREALELAEHADLGARQAGLLSNLGVLASHQGDLIEAESRFRAGLALARKTDDRPLLGTLLTNLGVIAARAGRLEEAEGFLNESLDLALSAGNRRALVFYLSNLGTLAHDRGDDERAWTLFRHALVQARAIGDQAHIGHILANLGALATGRREFEHAEALLQEGLALARAQDHQVNLVLLLINSGQLAKERGELERALAETEEALDRARGTGNGRYAAHAQAYLGELLLLGGDMPGARKAYREALQSAERLGLVELQADAVFGLAKVEAAQGKRRLARERAEKALQMYASLGHRRASDVVAWLEQLDPHDGG